MQKPRGKAWNILTLFIVGFSFTEFACAPQKSPEPIAIKINDHAVTVTEFQEVYSEQGPEKQDADSREKFVENLITRKLLLLEAQKEGLDQKKDFLKSIKNFWEQTLLKKVVDQKVSELAAGIQASDSEIEQAYGQWVLKNPGSLKDKNEVRDLVRWQIIQEKQAQALQEWTDELRKRAQIQVNRKAVGLE